MRTAMNEEQHKPTPGLSADKDISLTAEELKLKGKESLEKTAEKVAEEAAAAEAQAASGEAKPHPAIKPLRSFQADAAAAIEQQNASVLTIKLAEDKRRIERAKAEPQTTVEEKGASLSVKAVSIVLSGILVLVGVSIFIFSQFFAGEKRPDIVVYNTIMPYDRVEEMDASGADRDALVAMFAEKRSAQPGPQGSVTYFKLYTAGATGKTEMTAQELLSEKLQTGASQTLLRSLDGELMAGAYATSRQEAFILIKVASFDNAYSGMLAWEETLAKDLGPLITSEEVPAAPASLPAEPAATTTDEAAPAPSVEVARGLVFEDLVIDNRDARVVRNAKGEVVMVYSFINKNMLVVTTNEAAFRGVTDKFISSKLVR